MRYFSYLYSIIKNANNMNKFRVGQDVYYTSNYGTMEMGKIQKLNIVIEGSEHLGKKFAYIDTGKWKNGWPVMATVTMSRLRPIL
jgi:hypothetical protein